MKKIKLLVIAAVMTVGATSSCSVFKKETKEVVKEQSEIVVVQEVKSYDVPDYVSYNGTIEPYKRNNISSASPGARIEDIFIEVGDNVKVGDIIAEMDKSQYIQQSLQLENIATDLARLEELYKAGGVSLQQVQQMRTQYDVAKKALSYLKENTTLCSPISGIVTARNYDKGDLLSGAVATIMQMDTLKVRINVSEFYFSKVKKGMSVDIKADSYGDEIFKGEISLIFPLIDAATHSFTVEVAIPNKNLRLRPGMFTNVDLTFGTKNLIVVNDMAVQKQVGSNEKYIFIIEDGIAKRKSVITGRIYSNGAEIVSGAKVGDQIVVKGAGRLIEGNKVKIVKE